MCLRVCVCVRERERGRERQRDTDRQTERERDRQTERERERDQRRWTSECAQECIVPSLQVSLLGFTLSVKTCQSVLCTVIHCRLMDATVYIKGFSHPTLYPVAFLVFPAKKEGSFRRSGEEKGRGL